MKIIQAATACSMLALWSASIHAEGWFWQSQARAFVEQNDNVRLSTSDVVDAASIGAAVSSAISLESETARVSLTPNAVLRQYSSNEDLDSLAFGVNGDASRIFERSAVGIKGNINKDTTLTSEFEDSGNLRVKIDRVGAELNPYFRYKLTPLSAIKVSAGYKIVDYDDGVDFGYYDYDVSRFDLGYELLLTRRDTINARIYSGFYNADGTDSSSDTVGASIGIEHKFTERTSASADVGGYNLDSTVENAGGDLTDSSTGSSFRLGVNHKSVLTGFSLSVSSRLEPSSLGFVRQTDRADVSVTHSFTPRASARLNGTVLRNESTTSRNTSDDRDYHSVEASAAWHLDSLWRLRASYRYADQEYDNSTESATSNRFSVSVEYSSLKSNF